MLFLQIDRSIIVGGVYRPQDFYCNELFDALDTALNIFVNKKIPVWILGDFNIDLIQESIPQKLVCQTIVSNGFSILNKTNPTRITNHSATCIDYVMTNTLNFDATLYIVDEGFGDHQLQLLKVTSRRSAITMSDIYMDFWLLRRAYKHLMIINTSWV
uniref:Uncharacterized protein LOC114343744 n=1 Tax=Diabrotica virgifera virgifera TaxID=50390 RepID=A0A6P7H2Y3_DIAVI